MAMKITQEKTWVLELSLLWAKVIDPMTNWVFYHQDGLCSSTTSLFQIKPTSYYNNRKLAVDL